MTAEAGMVDYLCNSFLPDRRALWDASISSSGVPDAAKLGIPVMRMPCFTVQ